MNIVFYILIILGSMVIYFLLSFLFEAIGNIAIKLVKIFKKNIMDSEEKVNDE